MGRANCLKTPWTFRSWSLIAAALLVALLAISTQSFWMDEASTARSVTQPTLGGWWQYLTSHSGTDTQMPLFMLYIWGWVKLFGCTEWGLRAANAPWLVLGFLALPRRQAGYVLVLALSPFLWFYADEARPYVMQIAASLVLAGSLVRLLDLAATAPGETAKVERRSVGGFCFGLIVLSGSSMLGMIWAGAAVGSFLLLLGVRYSARLARQCWLPLLVTALILTGFAGYYLWTLRHGNAATPGATGLGNVVFIAYELCGFAGLGPGRADIHGSGMTAFRSWYLLPLAIYGLVTATVLFAGVGRVIREIPRRIWLGLLLPLGGVTLLLLVAGKTRHMTMLGRHFAPLGVCLLLLVGAGVQRLGQAGGWRRFLAFAWLFLSLISAVSLRWCDRHQKDDYRAAARLIIAAQARGERVWWCADGTCGFYYAVPLSPPLSPVAVPGKVWLNANAPAQWLTNNPMPTLVLLSKPELHDRNGVVRDYLQRNHFVCQASFSVFTVWTHP